MMTSEQQLRLLEVELAKAKAEATQLRKRLSENTRHQKRIERAYEDALLMAFWQSVGIKPSRRFAARYEITQDRWQNALALLRMARIIQGRSRWPEMPMETVEKWLALARDKAIADPGLFFLRHTRHRIR
jgi:hypothetical protein